MQHIGVIGGTFDPIHYGHLVIAEEVRAALHLSKMVFMPAGQPPHKPVGAVTAAHHRLAMLELAVASNPHFAISRIELERSGPSYLVDTLRQLHEQWGPQTVLSFVIGWDSLEELHTWYNPDGILAQLTYLVAVKRPGYDKNDDRAEKALEARSPGRLLVVPAPLLDISATDLRTRVAVGRPIKYQTPEAVESYIVQHGLYQKK